MSQFVVRSRASQTTQLSAPQTTRSSSSSGTPPPLLPQGLKDKLARLAGEAHVRGRNIACYGFVEPRKELIRELRQGWPYPGRRHVGHTFTMNELNEEIRLDRDNAMAVLRFLQENRDVIRSQSVQERVTFYCEGYIPKPASETLAGKWLYFLMEHVESVDILSKLSNLVKESEKTTTGGALRDNPSRLEYVKGSPERLHQVLVSFLHKNDKWKQLKSPDGADDTVANSAASNLVRGLKKTPPVVPRYLNTILIKALFRQTSKLGLRFCAEQKIPVAFRWEQYTDSPPKRDSPSNSDSPPTGWLQKPTAGSRRAIKSFVPITGSEMRMVVSEPTIKRAVTTVQRDKWQNDFTQPEGVQRQNKLS